MLKLSSVGVSYGKIQALDMEKQTLSIAPGERWGMIGHNGAGKSTLVKAVLGIVPYTGEIEMNYPRDSIAVHMQSNEYDDVLPVKQVMQYVLDRTFTANDPIWELIDFFEFRPCLKQRFKELSGGQKQRMTIILLLSRPTPLLILDEVTSGLDFESRRSLMMKLAEWQEKNANSLLIISHYYEELERLIENLVILNQGKIIAAGNLRDLCREHLGRAVITLQDKPENQELARAFKQLQAAEGSLAIRCDSIAEELQVCERLVAADVNYKRSEMDIEILSLNVGADKVSADAQSAGV